MVTSLIARARTCECMTGRGMTPGETTAILEEVWHIPQHTGCNFSLLESAYTVSDRRHPSGGRGGIPPQPRDESEPYHTEAKVERD